ncbi:MAG: glycosyltransferase [Lachnospiraceae bacterium]|nr:glycosyltransferase [Lachnospiraceae bacterium]
MKKCELSIIIPIYNGDRFLKETLDSVLNQSYKDYELILVDDGSTDDTARICDLYAAKDTRIRVRHQQNGGMSNARDNGYKMAQKDTWIAFLDADDIFHRDMFRDMMKYKNSDFVIVCFKNVLSSKISDCPFDIHEKHIKNISGKEMLYRLFEPEKNNGNFSIVGMLINRDFYAKMQKYIYNAKAVLPQNYLNDVYCVPRLFFYAEKVTLLNNAYIHRRISRYTDSRLIKPNALHYELALANKMNLEFYKKQGCRFAYEKHLIGFYLVILKLWYQIVTSEPDLSKQKKYVKLVEKYYKEYHEELVKIRCRTFREHIIKRTILLWGVNKTFWKITVGNIRYGVLYRIQT